MNQEQLVKTHNVPILNSLNTPPPITSYKRGINLFKLVERFQSLYTRSLFLLEICIELLNILLITIYYFFPLLYNLKLYPVVEGLCNRSWSPYNSLYLFIINAIPSPVALDPLLSAH